MATTSNAQLAHTWPVDSEFSHKRRYGSPKGFEMILPAHFRPPIARYSRPKRSRIIKKPRKKQPGDNPAYRAFVRTFGCVVCCGGRFIAQCDAWDGLDLNGPFQKSLTECAHVGLRGVGRKCPDCESLPLCAIEHHRVGLESHHKLGKRFWGFHGLDRTFLIKQLNSLWAEEQNHGLGSKVSARVVLGDAR